MTSHKHNNRFSGQSDETLMQLASKDQEAFAELVLRHQEPILNFFRRMGDYNSVDDLAQRTFIRLFKYRDKYRPKAKFTTFLYLLARRTWIDHLRSKERSKEAGRWIREWAELNADRSWRREDDISTRVSTALDTLSEEMRTVVVMSVYQGFKYREIAEITGIPLGTVKTRMFHAMKKLKESLTDAE